MHEKLFRLWVWLVSNVWYNCLVMFQCLLRGCSFADVGIPFPATLESAWREEKRSAWIWERELLMLTRMERGINRFLFLHVMLLATQSTMKKYRYFHIVRNREGSGRKQKLSQDTSEKLLNNLSTSGIEISKSTLQKTLKKERFTAFRPRKRPLLQHWHIEVSFQDKHPDQDASIFLVIKKGEAFKFQNHCSKCEACMVGVAWCFWAVSLMEL